MEIARKDVVVIGAGLSGLICAHRLKQLGIDVLLLENSERAGGVIRSEIINGFMIERGPNSAQGSEELLALVEELGITGELIEGDPKAPAYVYFNERLHAVPMSPPAFLKSKLLGFGGKLRILAEPFIAGRRAENEESVASFVRRRIGGQAAERLVAPFVSGIYAGDAEQLSIQAAFPRLANLESSYGGLFRGMIAKAREAKAAKKAAAHSSEESKPRRKRICSFKKGMSFLTETLAAHIGEELIAGCGDLRTSDLKSEISDFKFQLDDYRFAVKFTKAGNYEFTVCKDLIIATPAFIASKLVSPLSSELSRLLSEIEYPPLSIAHLAYDRTAVGHDMKGFGFLATPSANLKILGCVWNTSLFEDRAPSGKVMMTVFIGGARHPELARLADAELAAAAHSELQRILNISGEPQVISITRYTRAIPQYNLGHAERVRTIEKLLSETTGLHLAGNYLRGVSTGDCIKEAGHLAKEIRETLHSAQE